MRQEPETTRRGLFVAAGAAGLGVLALPSKAEASKWERLDKALVEMREAKKFLENAPAIFGGHKKKAIDALSSGIDEIEAAIKFAEGKK
jgi:hypothetical protein